MPTRTHTIKSWPQYFGAILSGAKPFEVRNNDRDYRPGDILDIREWAPPDGKNPGQYTGRSTLKVVTWAVDSKVDTGLAPNMIAFGIRALELSELAKITHEGSVPHAAFHLKNEDRKIEPVSAGAGAVEEFKAKAREVYEEIGRPDKWVQKNEPVQHVGINIGGGGGCGSSSSGDVGGGGGSAPVVRYLPNGTPLTDHERKLLVILMEEASEVIQAASKVIRFGRENIPPSFDKENTVLLGLEIGDLEHMIDVITACDLVAHHDINAGKKRKGERLSRYLQSKPLRAGVQAQAGALQMGVIGQLAVGTLRHALHGNKPVLERWTGFGWVDHTPDYVHEGQAGDPSPYVGKRRIDESGIDVMWSGKRWVNVDER